MARRTGFERALIAASREIARQGRVAEQTRKRQLREQAARARENQKHAAQQMRLRNMAAKEAKAAYLEEREEEVRQLNLEAEQTLSLFSKLLHHTLHVNDAIEFDSLRINEKFEAQKIPKELLLAAVLPDSKSYFVHLKAPSKVIAAIMPWKKRNFDAKVAEATRKAQSDLQKIRDDEAKRVSRLDTLKTEILRQQDEYTLKVAMRDAEVDAFRDDYAEGDPDALVAYFSMVLEHSEYPDNFLRIFR